MRKLVYVLIAATAITAFNPVNVEAKVYNEKQAKEVLRDDWLKAETKAYEQQKKVTRTYKVKTKEFKKATRAITNYMFIRPDFTVYYSSKINSDTRRGFSIKLKRGKNTTTVKLTVDGKNKKFRKSYKLMKDEKKVVALLKKKAKGKSQVEKAWVVGQYLVTNASTALDPNDLTKYSYLVPGDLLKAKAEGYCTPLAEAFAHYAKKVGVKRVGVLIYKKGDHMLNYYYDEKGKMYIYDEQDAKALYYDWDGMAEEVKKHSEEETERVRQDQIETYGKNALMPWECTACEYCVTMENLPDWSDAWKTLPKYTVDETYGDDAIYYDWIKVKK